MTSSRTPIERIRKEMQEQQQNDLGKTEKAFASLTNQQQEPTTSSNPLDASTLESAIKLAVRAHYGLRDRQGLPQILHVLRVMMSAATLKAMAVAVLHDAIEDTDADENILRLNDIPEDVVQAVIAISRRKDETYAEYIKRVATNELAREVKLLDLADNLARLHSLPHTEAVSLNERYRKARRTLNA